MRPDQPVTAAGFFGKGKTIMDDDFIEAINATADTSFEATDAPPPIIPTPIPTPVTFGANRIAKRPSGGAAKGFYRPGERDQNGVPFEVSPTKCPKYSGQPSGRAGNDDEKRGAWHLQDEYLFGRLGKNEEENGRLWNTVLWIDKHNRIATTPAEAIQGLNIYTDGSERLDRLDVDNPDGGFPDDVNGGYNGYENGEVDQSDKDKLDLKIDDYRIGRLVDDFKEIDKLAKIDVAKLKDKAAPLPQIDSPDPDQRVESGKIIRMLKVGMHTLWHPVIRGIDHATMTSLGKTQGAGDKVAAAVGRQRVIEGLRLAESIRRRLERQKLAPARSKRSKIPSVTEMMGPLVALVDKTPPIVSLPMIGDYEPVMVRQDNDGDTARGSLLAVLPSTSLPKPVRATEGHYLNMAAGPVIKKLLPANDNCRVEAIASKAA